MIEILNQAIVSLGQFFEGMQKGELINFGMLAVLTLSLGYTARSYRRQAWSLDYSSYLHLMARFSKIWRRFRDVDVTDKENKSYEFHEVLNQIEVSCLLWRCGTIKRAPKKMLKEKLKGYIGKFPEQEYTLSHLRQAISSNPEVFTEIRRFARKNDINLPGLEEVETRTQRWSKGVLRVCQMHRAISYDLRKRP